MARRKRITRKQLKQPDEFITLSVRIFNYSKENLSTILKSIGAVMLVLIIAAGWITYKRNEELKANIRFYRGMEIYLAAKEQQAKESEPSENSVSTFPEGADIKENYTLALGKFERVVHKYPGTKVARLALLYAGHSAFAIGDMERAIEFYQRYFKEGGQDPIIDLIVQEDLAHAQEQAGKFEEAIDTYQQIIDTAPSDSQKAQAMLGVARSSEKLGRTSEVISLYETILSDYPDIKEAPLIKARLNILRSQ